ncbi:MAG TPA: STAS domain-containing protein [Bryobacteraceae bacterium]|jgi:anti-sigma B factor antagonist
MVLKIEKRQLENGVTVLELAGRIAIGRESGRIEPEVVSAVSEGAKIVILDLTGVIHIDSTGIGIMAYCFGKATQAGAELRVVGARDSVLNLFQVTRLVRVVPFFPDLDSALQGNGRLS